MGEMKSIAVKTNFKKVLKCKNIKHQDQKYIHIFRIIQRKLSDKFSIILCHPKLDHVPDGNSVNIFEIPYHNLTYEQ